MIIGYFASLLDDDKVFEIPRKRHNGFCEGRPKGLEPGKEVPLRDIWSYDLWAKENRHESNLKDAGDRYEIYKRTMGG
jgi:hypothetical protein